MLPTRPGRPTRLRLLRLTAVAATVVTLAACSSGSPTALESSGTSGAPRSSSPSPTPSPSPTRTTPARTTPSPTHTQTPSRARTTSSTPTPTPSSANPASTGTGPVIVLDPGHAPSVTATDPATGLTDSDYENEPEMQDVFAVALLVKARLTAAGYRVILTKATADSRITLSRRAAVANNAHAALAVSIHDQAGANGGIQFSQGNNIVYYQSVGDYRQNPAGRKIYFTDSALAATSKRYGQLFQTHRSSAEGHSVRLQGDTGYDLGSRGKDPGDIWTVQLDSRVPWIYNEAGGNSAGQVGLSSSDKQRYADGLVTSIEACVPA